MIGSSGESDSKRPILLRMRLKILRILLRRARRLSHNKIGGGKGGDEDTEISYRFSFFLAFSLLSWFPKGYKVK